MRRHLIYAVSVLALAIGAEPLFAAEVGVPAKKERAAPRERAAPQRARAPERAAPVRQAAAQPAQTSWTGGQAGGFGGGNVGGGSFADPIAFCGRAPFVTPFSSSIPGQVGAPCPATRIDFSGDHKVTATGGGFIGYNVQVAPFVVVGIEGDIAAARIKASSVQSNTHSTVPPDCCGSVTTETYNASFTQGTNGSVRGRIGVPINEWGTMFYATGGVAIGKVDATFNYVGSNYIAGCAPFSACATANAAGSASYSQTRTGYTVGGGAEWGYLPGVKLRIEYRYTSFGSFSFNVPVLVTAGCVPGAPCATGDVVNVRADNHTLRVGVGFGM